MEILNLTPYHDTNMALLKLAYTVATMRVNGVPLLKVVHGEGRLYTPVRQLARKYKAEGKLRCLVYGEHMGSERATVQYLLNKVPGAATEAADGGVTYLYFG